MIPRVIPTLLLHGSGLYKTRKFRNPVYVGDPVNAVRIFNEKEVDELILLDIRATRERTPVQFDLIKDIAQECFMPLAYGGGLGNLTDIETIFELGVEKVVLNSVADTDLSVISDAARTFGSQAVVACIDYRRRRFGGNSAFTRSGSRRVKADLCEYARSLEGLGAGELFLNSIERDGEQCGYDLGTIRDVSEVTDIPVVACGGASSLADFREAIAAGASAVAAGSMFVFHGRRRAVLITYPERAELKRLFND